MKICTCNIACNSSWLYQQLQATCSLQQYCNTTNPPPAPLFHMLLAVTVNDSVCWSWILAADFICYCELLVRFKYFLFDLFRVRAISISLFSHLTGFFTVFKAGFFMCACFYCLVSVFHWCRWSWCFGVREAALAVQLTAAKLLFFYSLKS